MSRALARPAGGEFGPQDARSNLAVQPAAVVPKINLKKAAVKIVRPASGLLPTAPKIVATPVTAKAKIEDGHELLSSTVPPTSTKLAGIESQKIKPEVDISPPKSYLSTSKNNAASALDAMFARLDSQNLATSPDPHPPSNVTTEGGSVASSCAISILSKEAPVISRKDAQSVDSSPQARSLEDTEKKQTVLDIKAMPAEMQGKVIGMAVESMSKEELEREYLKTAAEFLNSLPTGARTGSVIPIQSAMRSFHQFAVPEAVISSSAKAETLKRKCVAAVATYLNQIPQNINGGLKGDVVSKIFEDVKGDFLYFCAKLVDEKVLRVENLNQVLGLCHVLNNALSAGGDDGGNKSVDPGNPAKTEKNIAAAISRQEFPAPLSAWPTQGKRENVAGIRTVILKGVASLPSINKLQAFVWGGRLESLSFELGKGIALVKFLTAEGCKKYFDATVNGIPIPREKELIFVELATGPNSLNDVLQNCIEGEASRCVRAVDADEDWDDMVLLNLARGKGKTKREVDRIKHGRTVKGRYYIEFRFANIYNALSFKRALQDDMDWEQCTIGFAKDPCEVARGVHLKDEDEDTGFF
ncbi:uncharacterized protein BDR25DRAFT_274841 [Lindgomyces ingoldianus]|uniref:Uncharacterized protein n=1 Tax=Lindgomyces ingoldianus TaxID=673940 RepID=A0ACB6RGZ6_9PLEO|nr:uncharacterized protein BDR25DRAFT_274841 [Lindgomyces ingoldianus]KAF2477592.1 hypothetical protein BDR25DRAFT_274841 [Lindgomyces ingoldianus]